MPLTPVERFSIKLPARGRVKFGIKEGTLDGYVNGTGFLLDAAEFKLSTLMFVSIVPADAEGAFLFDWNPTTGYVKAWTNSDAAVAEAANDALDAVNVRIFYVGF